MRARRGGVLCAAVAVGVITTVPVRAQDAPPMKTRVTLGAAGEFDADLQYYDPSDLFLRVKDSRVMPYWVAAKNVSTHDAQLSYGDFTLRLGNGKAVTTLTPIDIKDAEAELKQATSLSPLLRVLAGQGSEYGANPLRRTFRSGRVSPGKTTSGWVFFLRPAGLAFNGFMEFGATGRPPALVPTASVTITVPPAGARAGPVLPDVVVRAINAASTVGSAIVDGPRPFGKSYAVLFGISEYDYRNDLKGPTRDLANLSRALTAQGFDTVITIANRDVTADTLRNVQARFKGEDALQPDDRLLVYYSGHGERSPTGDSGYIVLSASNPTERSRKTEVSMGEFMTWMKGLPVKHLLVILDACYSGLAISDHPRGDGPMLDRPNRQQLYELSRQSGRFVMTAGDDTQLAHEDVRWDGGLFTRAILRALETRDVGRPNNKLVTTYELFSRAKQYVTEQVRQYGLSPQAPLFYDLGETPHRSGDTTLTNRASRGEFVFVNP
jgi:Caspase domain